MDLLEDDPKGGNTPEFTVSEVSGAVKKTIEGQFGHIRVRGEIGRVNRHRSGHVYYDLKDDRSVLAAVSWRGMVAGLGVVPEEGLEVIATGRLTTYGQQSKYQMVVERLAPAGVGALMAMLEKRRKALEAEGLFAADRKRPLPFLPEVIGVITSPQGAVIRDILHRLRERFPRQVLIWPVAVQGERCAPQVVRAIEAFNALIPGGPVPRPDVLIVARGGGSVEDLWGFNDEAVVRAAAGSAIPLISAVGHETDTTLIDHAADRRAPTPTAAAEMAVPVRLDLMARLDDLGARLRRAAGAAVLMRRQRLRDLARALPQPGRLADPARQRLDMAAERLPRALSASIAARRGAVMAAQAALHPRHLRGLTADARGRADGLAGRLGRGAQRARAVSADCLAREAARLPSGLAAHLERTRGRWQAVGGRLSLGPLARDLARQTRARTDLAARLDKAVGSGVAQRRSHVAALERVRQSFDHGRVLARGFALVRGPDGGLITQSTVAAEAARLSVEFSDGRVSALPMPEDGPPPEADGAGAAALRKKARGRSRPAAAPPAQPGLFDE